MRIPEPRRLASGRWNVQVAVNGRRRSITRETRDDCIRAAMLLKSRAKDITAATADRLTVGQILDDYIDSRRQASAPSTLRNYEILRRVHFQRVMGLPFASVSLRAWQTAANEMLLHVAPSSAAQYWSTIKAALKRAGLPVPAVVLPKQQKRLGPYLLPDQIPVFIDAIHGHPYELQMLLGLHGLRVSEACAVRWRDVDLKRHIIQVNGAIKRDGGAYVRQETTKNAGSRRAVPIMIPRLETLLASMDKTKPLPLAIPSNIYAPVNTVCRKAGLPEIGTHGLRRSFASLAYHLGVPERIAMEIGGWSNVGTMHSYYVQISRQDVAHYGQELRAFFEQKNDD